MCFLVKRKISIKDTIIRVQKIILILEHGNRNAPNLVHFKIGPSVSVAPVAHSRAP